jgi:hypothetical protein
MNQDLAVLIAALVVNVLAVTALSFAPSLTLSWLLFSVLSAATAVAVYSGWRVLDRALRLTTLTATRRVSTSEATAFQCSISDRTGLLVTYVGPDSCELSRLLAAVREIRRPVDPARRASGA